MVLEEVIKRRIAETPIKYNSIKKIMSIYKGRNSNWNFDKLLKNKSLSFRKSIKIIH